MAFAFCCTFSTVANALVCTFRLPQWRRQMRWPKPG